MIAIICLNGFRHARDFSLKVPAKPVIKTGAGVQGFAADTRGRPDAQDEAEIRKMVTIQLNNLIDFVAEVFSHSESSPEEARRIATYLTTANLTGHDSHGVIRVPVYIRWKKTGNCRSQPDPRDRGRIPPSSPWSTVSSAMARP